MQSTQQSPRPQAEQANQPLAHTPSSPPSQLPEQALENELARYFEKPSNPNPRLFLNASHARKSMTGLSPLAHVQEDKQSTPKPPSNPKSRLSLNANRDAPIFDSQTPHEHAQ
jgi:hypothetical protein